MVKAEVGGGRMKSATPDSEQILARTTAVEHHHAEADRFVRWYAEMARSRFANPFAYGRAKVDRLLDKCFKTLPQGARVLDVGCGTGEYVYRANELGFSACGVEPAEAMRKVAIEKNPNSKILDGVATALPFPDKSFDLVICIEVLRYLHRADNRQALREMHRVLRPDGMMFLTSVNKYALDGFYVHYRLRRLWGGTSVSAALPHCEFTTPADIDEEIRAAGFSAAVHHGVLFGPMRMLYKLGPRLAPKVVPALEPLDDAICSSPAMKRYAGHLVSVATR
jgi:ubiquinone/menaquinone biosynthesis C-methylase UbiE